MSGRSLFPLTISLARGWSEEFDGKLRISYSGGADVHNITGLLRRGHLADHHGHHRPQARRLSSASARSPTSSRASSAPGRRGRRRRGRALDESVATDHKYAQAHQARPRRTSSTGRCP